MRLMNFILVMQGAKLAVLVLDYLEIWSFVSERLSGVLIAVPAPHR